jgi:hypothetical protein
LYILFLLNSAHRGDYIFVRASKDMRPGKSS